MYSYQVVLGLKLYHFNLVFGYISCFSYSLGVCPRCSLIYWLPLVSHEAVLVLN